MKPKRRSRWPSLSIGILSVWLAAGERGHATGYGGPTEYLDQGGRQVDAAPEFYWEIEVKRLARDFRPAEPPKIAAGVFPPQFATFEEDKEGRARPGGLTRNSDTADFETALKEGRLKPADAAEARKQHEAARAVLDALPAVEAPLPPEFPSEFADYHRGAHAFRGGEEHYAEARTAWEALLARPTAERHYRSVWAAFMLGKLALKERKPEAVEWFQKTRALAKEGFADSLAMAADSYGWEGRSEWKQDHPDKAARLFLTQLALGDASAVISLKALIPDRDPVSGHLNYGPEPEEMEKWSDEEKKAADQKMRAGLRAAARDPLLRRLETVHILATETGYDAMEDRGAPAERENRIARWLSVLKEAGIKQTEDAEYVGWAAYQLGDYKGAAHWLEMAKTQTPAGLWLKAKLQRRAGKADEAAKSMVEAWKTLQKIANYTGWQPPKQEPKQDGEEAEEYNEGMYGGEESWGFLQHAGGNAACFLLARGEFLQAFDAFRKGNLWDDAAFVAESILTVDELKGYVDGEATAAPPPSKPVETATEKEQPAVAAHVPGSAGAVRWLLGRRLVRLDRYREAAEYLPSPYDKVVRVYAKALQDGANPKLDKTERARAWFAAAWIARHDGMEIMGTEVAPDSFATGGDFQSGELAQERRVGKYEERHYDEKKGKEVTLAKPVVLKPTKAELERLNKFRVVPDVRWHYRLIAGALAMKAAALLPDNTPELADVINTAGNWVKDRDNKLADQYYLTLMKRAGNTHIGRAARAKRWFVAQSGPWSEREDTAHEAAGPQ
jgi:tetratricopeptide (TPR) repeat protein